MSSKSVAPPPSNVKKTSKKSDFIRITPQTEPCPICGKPDWCMISADGKAVICARIESIKPAGQAGWLHKLDGTSLEDYQPSPPPEYTATQRPADPARRNEVYLALLDILKLKPAHYDNLLKRGLTEDAIIHGGYKSLSDGNRAALVAQLKKSGLKVAGVPGFCLSDDGVPTLHGSPGMLIPYRDINQLIVGMQIRRDNADGAGKYVWLSSYNKEYGVGSGSPAHIALPLDCTTTNIVFITEGALKANVVAQYLGCIVIGIGGVAAYRNAIEAIAYLKTPRKVVMAYDTDRMTNEAVHQHAKGLEKALLFNHFNTYEAVWDAKYKGLDDYLLSGATKLWYRVINDVKLTFNKYYKDTVAKGYNYEWVGVNALRDKATHLLAPEYLPPIPWEDCQCEYCVAVLKYQQEVIADALVGLDVPKEASVTFDVKASIEKRLKMAKLLPAAAHWLRGGMEPSKGEIKEAKAFIASLAPYRELAPHDLPPEGAIPYSAKDCNCQHCQRVNQWRFTIDGTANKVHATALFSIYHDKYPPESAIEDDN